MSERTAKQFDADLTELKNTILLMGGTIESMLKETKLAVLNHDAVTAEKILLRDEQVDEMEKEIDELAIKILALRQPVSKDLRFVTAALKISTDMERMGDEIVNICERLIELSEFPVVKAYEDLPVLLDMTLSSVTQALDSFVNMSSQAAGEVLKRDDLIDDLHRKIYQDLVEIMKQKTERIDASMKLVYIAKYLERIADHATNVSEQVIFMVEGLDVRHSARVLPTP